MEPPLDLQHLVIPNHSSLGEISAAYSTLLRRFTLSQEDPPTRVIIQKYLQQLACSPLLSPHNGHFLIQTNTHISTGQPQDTFNISITSIQSYLGNAGIVPYDPLTFHPPSGSTPSHMIASLQLPTIPSSASHTPASSSTTSISNEDYVISSLHKIQKIFERKNFQRQNPSSTPIVKQNNLHCSFCGQHNHTKDECWLRGPQFQPKTMSQYTHQFNLKHGNKPPQPSTRRVPDFVKNLLQLLPIINRPTNSMPFKIPLRTVTQQTVTTRTSTLVP